MGFLDNLMNKRHEKEKDRRSKKMMMQEGVLTANVWMPEEDDTFIDIGESEMNKNESGAERIIEWHSQNQNYAESSDEEAVKPAEETEITEEHKSEKDKYYQIAWNFYYDDQYEDALRVISYIDEHLSSSYRDMDIGGTAYSY